MKYEAPDLSMMSVDDLCVLMLCCGKSNEQSDKDFVKACRDEITKRKPSSPEARQPNQPL